MSVVPNKTNAAVSGREKYILLANRTDLKDEGTSSAVTLLKLKLMIMMMVMLLVLWMCTTRPISRKFCEPEKSVIKKIDVLRSCHLWTAAALCARKSSGLFLSRKIVRVSVLFFASSICPILFLILLNRSHHFIAPNVLIFSMRSTANGDSNQSFLLFSPLITSHQTTNASADARSATAQSATWQTSTSESWPPRWPSAASRNRKRSWASAFQRWSPSRSSGRWRLLSERQPLPQWPPPAWPISKWFDLISTLDFSNSKLVFNLPRHQNSSQVSGGRSACSDGAFGPGGDDECK